MLNLEIKHTQSLPCKHTYMGEHVGERIRRARKALGWTQGDLGDLVGVTAGAISQWENGDTANLKIDNLVKCADALKLSLSYLATGEGAPGIGNVSAGPKVYTLPLISWVAAGRPQDVQDLHRVGEGEPVYTTQKVGPHAYALRVVGDSMQNPNGRPTYPEGAIIIVDPDKRPVHKSAVIVRLEDSQQATFKQLIIDGDTKYLKPLNPIYPVIPITERATFAGVVVQTWLDAE